MGVAVALLTGASTLAQGYQAYQQGQYEQDQANADANAAKAAAMVEAGRIREIGRKRVASARAALAASGVSVDAGTGADLQQQVAQGAEQDAMTTILGGVNNARALTAAGNMAALRGKQAAFGSVLAAGGDFASGYSKWKHQGKGN